MKKTWKERRRVCKQIVENQPFVRQAVKPFKDFARGRRHKRYLRTPDHFYLKTLRNIHEGERCFILGNGPSLTAADCDKLIGEVSFAANKIFMMFEKTPWRPTYYVAVDGNAYTPHYQAIASSELGHMFLGAHLKPRLVDSLNKVTRIFTEPLEFDADFQVWNKRNAYISEDVSDHLSQGCTVTFTAIQLAIYMGFKEIYLLGVDNSYSVWLDEEGRVVKDNTINDYFDKRANSTAGYYFSPATLNYSYRTAREYCETHGIKIRNATRGGKLEVFERVNFDDLFIGGVRP